MRKLSYSRSTSATGWRLNNSSCLHLAPGIRRCRALDIDLHALDVPDIDGDIKSVKQELGAVFNDAGIALTYGNARQAVAAAVDSGVALVDRSHWGRLRVTGEGRLSFLHNQSTNQFMANTRAGQGRDTVFVTATARVLDLATALINEASVLLLVSLDSRQRLLQRFDKYIFPADKVQVQDVTERCAMLTLVGPEAEVVLREVAGVSCKQPQALWHIIAGCARHALHGAEASLTVLGQPYGTHQLVGFKGAPLVVAVGCGLHFPGYTLIVDEAQAGELFGLLASKVPAGLTSTLTRGVPPVFALPCQGCYIGQETLSKLTNLNGVKQQLVSLTLSGPVEPGCDIESDEGVRLGRVTSVATTPDGQHIALGFMKCKSKGQQVEVAGAKVRVGLTQATVGIPPFTTKTFAHQLDPGSAGPGADAKMMQAEEARKAKLAAAAAEAEAKAARLQAMQARLEAWKAQLTPTQGQGQQL
ncbi:hypothetical protein QJQ45_029159 [Haematococcus lacustris]|nr:hypothetical protein QJQ45_029159 [Haematococcus lacustris]